MILQERIKEAQDTEREDDVASLVLALLEDCEVTSSKGYKIIPQHRISNQAIPDIVVNVFKRNVPYLVIACKSFKGSMSDGEAQVKTYMIDGNYPYGILINPYEARWYHERFSSTYYLPKMYKGLSDNIRNTKPL